MLKQFCLRARRCKLTKSWPFWCHGDSHGKASHGRMDSSCVHYAMWGDHSSTQRGYSYKYCLTSLLNCYGLSELKHFWKFQFQDAVLGRIHFTETGELVYLTTAGDGPRLCRMWRMCRRPKLVPHWRRIEDLLGRGIGQWVHEGSLIAFQLDLFQYEAGVKL